jgi:hypothetical protein
MNGKTNVLLNIFDSSFITIRIFNVMQVVGMCRYLSQLSNHATSYGCAEQEKNLLLRAQTGVSKSKCQAYGSANSEPNYLGHKRKDAE